MTERLRQITDEPCMVEEENEINLLDYWRVIRKRRKMIIWIVATTMVLTTIISLFLTDIYRAKAVIIPVASREGGLAATNAGLEVLTQQYGGFPGSQTSTIAAEIVNLLNSNILKEKIIRQYNLMPILFYSKWDAKLQTWKPGYPIVSMIPFYIFSSKRTASPVSDKGILKEVNNIPDTWDALRLLDEIVTVSRNSKDNTITISVDFHDPQLAASIVDHYLVTLTNYMSSEVKRVASTNRKYLEEQLGNTTDPFIKQKTYNMIAQQIETGMMAEVKENFAFKVIDPPLAPDKTIKPKRVQIVLLSMVMSLFLGLCLAYFLEYLEKIKTKNGEIGK